MSYISERQLNSATTKYYSAFLLYKVESCMLSQEELQSYINYVDSD